MLRTPRDRQRRKPPSMSFYDDRKRVLEFKTPPRRVVSLVPSDTLTLADLGCGSALVGRTDYCELPADLVRGVPSVGGTKNPSVEKILALSPDLIVANQEENTKRDLEKLAQAGVRVFVSFPRRVADGLAHMARLARIFQVDRDEAVRSLCRAGYDAVRDAEAARERCRPVPTFCPIWMSPLMTIHGDTFISDMLALAGATNVFADRERRYPLSADVGAAVPWTLEQVGARDTRYPRVTMEEVNQRSPELVLLPDEPHPFSEADADVFREQPTPAAKNGAIVRTGGKDLCWYGSRSVSGLPRLRKLVDAYR
jgi:ABC-type Fe3+-hydroxamate transport system substrate-binding protein